MARPIKETPILTDDDAERFVERAETVEKMSKENPRERTKTVSKQYKPLEYELRWDW